MPPVTSRSYLPHCNNTNQTRLLGRLGINSSGSGCHSPKLRQRLVDVASLFQTISGSPCLLLSFRARQIYQVHSACSHTAHTLRNTLPTPQTLLIITLERFKEAQCLTWTFLNSQHPIHFNHFASTRQIRAPSTPTETPPRSRRHQHC